MVRWITMAAAFITLIGLNAAAFAQGEIRVVVTVAPLKGLIEPLLPEGSHLRVLMQPGRSEHGYEFSPEELADLARADVVVYVGLNLEPKVAALVAESKRPAGQRVVCFGEVAGIQKPGEPVPNTGHHEAADHEHGDECDHDHEGYVDQHLWLDPVLVKELLPVVTAAIKDAAAAKGATSEAQAKVEQAGLVVEARVQAVDAEWTSAFKEMAGAPIVTHHNAFSRPAERYGFKVAAVIRGVDGKDPTPADVKRVVDEIKAQKARAIFVEPQFNARAAERIAKVAKVKLARLDPLGDGDWFKLMTKNLESMKAALGESK
ncbi:MAG: metal ABC transporter substrate-binding protein [Phycisphaerales bacterium]